MNCLKNIALLFLIGFLSACNQEELIQPTSNCTYSGEFTINESHPKAAAIQSLMDKYLVKGIPGATVLIKDADGFWIKSKGFADLENNILMQPCHINKLGSVTKMMMGALIWRLVQEGTLNINAPISQYIPEVASKITNGADITVSMLLNHTSGVYDIARDLGYNLAVINDFTKSWTEEEILAFIANKPATNEAGAAVNYSNSNTLLEAMIVNKVTGRSHGSLMQEYIFSPLSMDNTVYYNYATSFPSNTLAQGYLDFNNDGGSIQNLSALNPGSGNGYTGVYSTVTDLYKFMNALLVEKTLTTPENLAAGLASMRSNDKNTYKTSILGIHREFMTTLPDSIIAYGHAGGDIGYTANLSYFPHNNTIFAATFNYGTNLPSALGDELQKFRNELALIMAE
jgi:D-alanyl-D-alanine carboxypeptidase